MLPFIFSRSLSIKGVRMKSFSISLILTKISQHQDLNHHEMTQIMQMIIDDQLTPAQLGAFLMGMRMKGETVEELVAAIKILTKSMTPVGATSGRPLIDIVGTGGDQAHTFNISTASSLVVAAAGGIVAKHGNRSLSSSSGSADVLEAAGVNLNLNPEQIAECIDKINIGFMFAPSHHKALQQVAKIRKELEFRTFFNLIGPLLNPAGAKYHLMGVFAKQWVEPIANVLKELGETRALVVHSEDGLDEISINAPTFIAELKDKTIKTYTIVPEQFGFKRNTLDSIKVANAQESLALLKQVLANKPGPARDIVCLNSGAALYVAGITKDLAQGIKKAQEVLASGAALKKLNELIQLTQNLCQIS